MLKYIEGTEVKFTVYDRIYLNVEFYDGLKYEGLKPHRLFPVTGLARYIALMDGDGEPLFIINNLENLLPESKKAVEKTLSECYIVPKILNITGREDKYGVCKWEVETTHGETVIEITDSMSSIKRLYDDRVLVKDCYDNRYEIPDIKKLNAKSIQYILPDI